MESSRNLTWEDFVNGNEEAFSTIYREHYNDLYSYGLNFVSNSDLVKDSIQEIFVHLHLSKHKIKVRGNFRVYLLKALRNQIKEELRSKTRKVEIEKNIAGNDLHSIIDSIETDISELEQHQHLLRIITQAMQFLSRQEREAIYLRYTEGCLYEEIAEILNISIASARTMVYRGIKKIKSKLPQSVAIF